MAPAFRAAGAAADLDQSDEAHPAERVPAPERGWCTEGLEADGTHEVREGVLRAGHGEVSMEDL